MKIYISGSGFKLEYSTASCSRTHTEPYGRIFSPSYPYRYKLHFVRISQDECGSRTVGIPLFHLKDKNKCLLHLILVFSFRGSYNCTNVISTDEGKTVSLYFRNFHLAESVNCTLNYLEIRDGQTAADPLLARLCSRWD